MMDALADVLLVVCAVILAGCGLWAWRVRHAEQRRALAFAARITPGQSERVDGDAQHDANVQAGLDRLWAAVAELHRDVEARDRGELS